jgi:hypothetical protein
VSWAESREAFQEHHIPDGLMDRKQQEFLGHKQESSTVYEYYKRFIYLHNMVCAMSTRMRKRQPYFARGYVPRSVSS